MQINGTHFRTIWPAEAQDFVEIIDQTRLPHAFEIVKLATLQEMSEAIRSMRLRGAPLIGAAAAYGMALAMRQDGSDKHLQHAVDVLLASRPTAVNLRWAVERMRGVLQALPPQQRTEVAWAEAARICDEDVALNQAIARHGLMLIQRLLAEKKSGTSATSRRFNILTHCNAGWLATVDWGTALAPIYAAFDAGMDVHVWVGETRPRNQGASLTAWELGKHGVPHTVVSDNAGGHLMQHGEVDMVIVGADRVTRTGDVCNKIGTYLKALAAHDNGIPFYVAVPSPTIDWGISDGLTQIPIEERSANEVACISGCLADGSAASVRLLPAGTSVANPAFDVTPSRLVTGIITERGICTPGSLAALFSEGN
jgi:methylthioribose-1-phosphate isomerase